MDKMRLVYVEDTDADFGIFMDTIERFKGEKKVDIECKRAKTKEEAKKNNK